VYPTFLVNNIYETILKTFLVFIILQTFKLLNIK